MQDPSNAALVLDTFAALLGAFCVLYAGTAFVKWGAFRALPEGSLARRTFRTALPMLPSGVGCLLAVLHVMWRGAPIEVLAVLLPLAGFMGAFTSQVYHTTERLLRWESTPGAFPKRGEEPDSASASDVERPTNAD